MAFHHDVVCPTLIARESELTVARESLERARNGNAHVTLIVGEAGVGKSRLLREMIDAARESGFLILKGVSNHPRIVASPHAPTGIKDEGFTAEGDR